jgi:UTP--glucose-1-phosphate uridylyltransferase
MRPTTAVIFAAGYGTRMLPITSAVQKELLPIGNRPVIDYVVSDCVAAGVTRIIFVVRPHQTGLKDYYLGNADLEHNLTRLGKTAALTTLKEVHNQAKFEFIEQPSSAGYGTAVPLQTALPLLTSNEPVLVCGGDDFVWCHDGSSEIARFIDTFAGSQATGAIMSLELPANQLSSYGVLTTKASGASTVLTRISEKPMETSSGPGLVNISKYILGSQLLGYVRRVTPDESHHESLLTDAVNAAAVDHEIVVHTISGQYLDTGSPKNWLRANNVVAGAR